MDPGLAYKYPLVDGAFHFLASIRRYRKIRPRPTEWVGVNLGSGLLVSHDWIHIDTNGSEYLAKLPNVILRKIHPHTYNYAIFSEKEYIQKLKKYKHVHHDFARFPLPFETESVDVVYSSHVLEHLYYDNALKLLKEVYRILKPDGIIRTVVPDLDKILPLFKYDRVYALSYFFSPSNHSSFGRHRFMYDKSSLEVIHQDAGFRNAQITAYRIGLCPHLQILDTKPQESIYLEARK